MNNEIKKKYVQKLLGKTATFRGIFKSSEIKNTKFNPYDVIIVEVPDEIEEINWKITKQSVF